ncbi:MAG: hypothetical protein JWM95_196 [Gemmatimonadetes bacterium]|nr:hypothetical protein [Gemmatimonadota bacterium]
MVVLAAIAAATVLAFSPALNAPFQFDDIASIVHNQTITRAWPPGAALTPPPAITVSGRPVVNYSLALNYAVSGASSTFGYHAANLALHVLCGLLVFGIVRRTLRAHAREHAEHGHAESIALAVTALWLLHPIQTEAVDYVIQRTELLVSVFLAATLYASIRAWDASSGSGRAAWYATGTMACLLGMGSKEVMVSAPLIVILWDRVFHSTSWSALLEKGNGRRWFYLALLVTSSWLIALVAAGSRAETVGLSLGLSWQRYFYSQAWAVLHYLRLLAWPVGLSYDYGQEPVTGLRGVPGLVVLGAFFIATCVAWTRDRWRWFAFVGTVFFLLLGPSSSVIPIRTEIAAERRVYLASVGMIVLFVLGVHAAARRVWTERRGAELAGLTAVCVLLALVTYRRSSMYRDPELLWRDAMEQVPMNPRAYDNLAAVVLGKDKARIGEAEALLRHAISIDSTYASAWTNLADVEVQLGRPAQALALLEHVVRANPELVDATARLGGMLVRAGDPVRAIPMLERAAAVAPTEETLVVLAIGYESVGRHADSQALLQRVWH